jgi:hypothetical protein
MVGERMFADVGTTHDDERRETSARSGAVSTCRSAGPKSTGATMRPKHRAVSREIDDRRRVRRIASTGVFVPRTRSVVEPKSACARHRVRACP